MAGHSVQEALAAGDLPGAIAAQKAAIRQAPTVPEPRFLLFQLQCLAGDWTGAANQLAAQRKLLPAESPFLQMLEGLVKAETVREEVFRGVKAPKILGEPAAWIAPLVRALESGVQGRTEEAAALRRQAWEESPGEAGSLNGEPFAWLTDGDSRLGPVLEIVLNGTYFWVPQARVRKLAVQAPEQPRDLVWALGQITLETGADLPVFLPARYPFAAAWSDDALRLGRATEWDSPAEGTFEGRGQKVWMTEAAEHGLLAARNLEIGQPAA
ncbi:MAG TPA: type VI secretion system accessory protein TagJ [Chthoniobacteraceae bacterium]|jgi:type VI secretion system protein ImpE|nr:type VI secretion system accessory protein TagJ [Chthoniobacteraceae bacterium]